MPDKPRFTGHRVVGISFKKGWIECDCGQEFTVTVDPDFPYVSHEALAAAFWAHRKAESLKAKLEFIEGGDTTLEREFMPYTVLKSGKTLGELMDAGGLPLLTAG